MEGMIIEEQDKVLRKKNITTTSHDQCMNPVLNKLLWDFFKIQTDNKVEHNKPDIVVLDKIERKCLILTLLGHLTSE